MLTATHTDGPTFHTKSHTQNTSPINSTAQPNISPQIPQETAPTPKPITEDRLAVTKETHVHTV